MGRGDWGIMDNKRILFMDKNRATRRTYNQIVKSLQYNDRNATWDEIFYWCDYEFNEAIASLFESLKRVVHDEGYEGEQLEFYASQFSRAKKLMEVSI